MRGLLVPALDLFLGARCAGCGAAALLLCRSCTEATRPVPATAWPRPVPVGLREPFPVEPVAAGTHAGILRAAVVAWKEEGNTRLTPLLAHHLAAAVAVHSRAAPLALVPVPTSARSRRSRGADLVDDLARAAAVRLRRVGVDVVVVQALGYGRRTVDQAALGASERAANLAGALRCRGERLEIGRDVVVVDDILTTGSTVTEAVRALTAAGRRPVGIAVVAATARLS